MTSGGKLGWSRLEPHSARLAATTWNLKRDRSFSSHGQAATDQSIDDARCYWRDAAGRWDRDHQWFGVALCPTDVSRPRRRMRLQVGPVCPAGDPARHTA